MSLGTEPSAAAGGTRSMGAVLRRLRVPAVLLGLSLVLHLPGLVHRLYDSDEASIATMAMVINSGGTLYHQTADRKPPVVPYLYAGVFRVTGSHDLRPVRAVGLVSLAATALLLAHEARRRYKNDDAALACGVVFLLASAAFFPADSQAAGFELFMLLPMTAAVIAAGRGRALQAGLWLAVAALTKQTAVAAAVPVAYLLLRNGGWRPVVQAGVTSLGVIAATALVFGPSEFLLWTVTGNRGYLSNKGPVIDTVFRGLGMSAAFLGVNLALLALCAMAVARKRVTPDLWMWVAGGVVSVLAGMRFYGHYYLQLFPPLALMAAAVVPEVLARRRWLLGAVAAPTVVMVAWAFVPPDERGLLQYGHLAAEVRAQTTSDERIFVWGSVPEIYWAAGREPATRFIHTGFITGNTGGRPRGSGQADDGLPGADRMLVEDFRHTPPELILDTSTADIRNGRQYPFSESAVWDIVTRDYRYVKSVDGVAFYRRVRPGL